MVRWLNQATRDLVTDVFESTEKILLSMVNVDRYLPLQLDITNACNLSCAHCYHSNHSNDGVISLTDWTSVLQEYFELCAQLRFRPYVIIGGGEPLTSSYLRTLALQVAATHPKAPISILSNATLATSKRLADLSLPKTVRFQVSLDGPDESRHDLIRGRGSFSRTIQGIHQLNRSGYRVDLLSVLSNRSSLWLSDFFDLAQTLPVESMGFTRLIVSGYAKKLTYEKRDLPLNANELRAAYQSILLNSARTGVRSNTTSPLMHLLHDGLGRSGRFWEGIIVSHQGEYLASSRTRIVLGRFKKDRMRNVLLDHPLMRALRSGEIDVCGSCPDLRICGGDRNAAFAATGNYLAADPGCWKNVTR